MLLSYYKTYKFNISYTKVARSLLFTVVNRLRKQGEPAGGEALADFANKKIPVRYSLLFSISQQTEN